MIDSHTHLYLPDFDPEPEATVRRAIDAGVRGFMFPNVDLGTIGPMKALAAKFPGASDMAMGLHPTEVDASWRDAMTTIEHELATGTYRAVGEIGIDLYWDRTWRDEQLKALRYQLELAAEASLPVIIHCREGLDEIMAVIDSMPQPPRGVFHSFTGDEEQLRRINGSGDFYIGVNGIITFKNSKLGNVVKLVDHDRLLLETDSPYLAPVPMRGKRNESAYIMHTAAHTAAHTGMDTDTLSQVTDANYRRLFTTTTIL